MEEMDMAKQALDKVTLVCPECGKKPANCSVTALREGIVKEDISCCSGTGFVMVHAATGRVVDSEYTNAKKPGAPMPAYIPLVFAAAPAGGATSRTIGWLKESLLGAGSGCACSKEGGFWARVKHCLSKFWN